MFYCTKSGNESVFVYRWANFSPRLGQFSNSVAGHLHTNEVEVTPLALNASSCIEQTDKVEDNFDGTALVWIFLL